MLDGDDADSSCCEDEDEDENALAIDSEDNLEMNMKKRWPLQDAVETPFSGQRRSMSRNTSASSTQLSRHCITHRHTDPNQNPTHSIDTTMEETGPIPAVPTPTREPPMARSSAVRSKQQLRKAGKQKGQTYSFKAAHTLLCSTVSKVVF